MTRLRVVIAALLVLLGIGELTACSGRSGRSVYPGPTHLGQLIALNDRKPAGPVAGTLLTGGKYALRQDQGKVVVLNFFASWCGPCKAEAPQLEKVYQEQGASGARIVGLDVKDPRSGVDQFVVDKNVTYPVVFDEAAKSAIQLGDFPVTVLPQTVIIDRHGRVAALYVSALMAQDLRNVLAQLAKEA